MSADPTIIVASIGFTGTLLASALGAVANWRKSEQIHVIVNNQRSEMTREIDVLKLQVLELRATIAGVHMASTAAALTDAAKPSN